MLKLSAELAIGFWLCKSNLIARICEWFVVVMTKSKRNWSLVVLRSNAVVVRCRCPLELVKYESGLARCLAPQSVIII